MEWLFQLMADLEISSAAVVYPNATTVKTPTAASRHDESLSCFIS
jgi:hypothetical protein